MPTKKILLVDDSCTARLCEQDDIQSKNELRSVSAVDGKKRWRERARKADLILMDIVMPRMTGLEACRVLKKDKATERYRSSC